MERELLLLGLLRRQEMHGYQLHDFIESFMQTCVDLKKPTAYFLLDRMEQQGWVQKSVEQVGNRPLRRVYTLTAEGEIQFQRLLRENVAAHLPARFAGDVGLAFLDELPKEEAMQLLGQRRVVLQQALDNFRAIPPHQGSLQLVIEHQVAHLQAELLWLEQVIGEVGASSER